MRPDNVYESVYWSLSGDVMRPGGVELTGRLLALSGLRPGARILDLGCGRGAATAYLARAGYDPVGMDQSEALLRQAGECCPNLPFVRGDATAIPSGDGAFDAVLLECVLSLVPAGKALAECARVIRAGGCLLISDVYDPDGDGPLSRPWWGARLAAAGFRCRRVEDRTRDLRNFAAQLLWDTGSLDGLCGRAGCGLPEKAGYFALIADLE